MKNIIYRERERGKERGGGEKREKFTTTTKVRECISRNNTLE